MSTAEQKKKKPIVWLKFISGPGDIKHQVIIETIEAIKKEKWREEHGKLLNYLLVNKNVYLKADRIFLATDAFLRLQYGMKNIFLNTHNILDTLDKVNIVFEEMTLEETLIYTLAYRANLNISHFSFSLLMNTYKDEDKNIKHLDIDKNIIYIYLGDRADLCSFELHRSDIRDNYTPELISTVQSLITLDYIRRNDAKIMLKPHQVGMEEMAKELANVILRKISTMRNAEEKLSTSTASPASADVIAIN